MKQTSIILTALLLSLVSCSDERGSDSRLKSNEIRISTSLEAPTRVGDNAFEKEDEIGIYIVNHMGDATLKNDGNHVNNMRFTYSGVWTPDTPVYWNDEDTHADFYVYYPYKKAIGDVRKVAVEVNSDQSSIENYKKSEVLAGIARNIAPTDQSVNLIVKHAMSQIMIDVYAGNGFTAEELSNAAIKVTINGVKIKGMLDIVTSTITATGSETSVSSLFANGTYKALLVPQTVSECNLITVNIDGSNYYLKKGFTFLPGKSHHFSIILSKTTEGVNVGIDGWETDDMDNGGVAE